MQMKFKRLMALLILPLMVSCDLVDRIENKSKVINNFERAALTLSQENRELKAEIQQLHYEIQKLKSEKDFLMIKLNKEKPMGRLPASSENVMSEKDDLVKQGIYNWKSDKLYVIAEDAFKHKNWEKSAQFYHALLSYFPRDKKSQEDEVWLKAGIAAYESKKHYDWSVQYLNKIIVERPDSKHYRGAKLWSALAYYHMGNKQRFLDTFEEFRKKYRNTTEWAIISKHYERFAL